MDRVTGKPRGFAFAEFTDPAKAADAIRRFDSFELQGRRLRVNDADDKPAPRAPRPMGAGPRPFGGPPPGGGMTVPSFDSPDFTHDPGFRRKGGSRRGLRAKKRSLR
jgi:RNA recognition motif-containing protein